MADSPAVPSADPELVRDLLAGLDKLFGLHAGYRAVHAKGTFCSGVFTPWPEARQLTRAPHASRASTTVTVRFSDFAGIPSVADNDPNGAGPRGVAIRFHLGDHAHTDIIGHSHDGFPTRTGEEFLQLLHALTSSETKGAGPTPVDRFFATHPRAKKFFETPHPIPSSFAREAFFAVTAFKFVAADGSSRFGRFRIRPRAGTHYLDAAEAAKKSPSFLFDELTSRLAAGPEEIDVIVQLAGETDDVADASIPWPESRRQIPFGTITLKKRENDNDSELRRIIFDPIPRVDGIEPSADPLIGVRSELYLLGGRRRRAAGVS
jgi:catalase